MEVLLLWTLPNFVTLFLGVTTRLQAEVIKFFKDIAKIEVENYIVECLYERVNRNKEMEKKDPSEDNLRPYLPPGYAFVGPLGHSYH